MGQEQPCGQGLAQGRALDDEVPKPRPRRDRDLELALAELRIFREETLVRRDARLALGLSRARRCAHPLELARKRLLARGLLLLLDEEPRALLLEPRAVVALIGDAEPAVQLENPAGDVVREVRILGGRDDEPRLLGQVALEPGDRLSVE